MLQPLINRRFGRFEHVALMVKDGMTGIISLEANLHGARVVSADSLAGISYERTFPSKPGWRRCF